MKRKVLLLLPVFILAAGFVLMNFFAGFKSAPPRRVPKKPVRYVETRTVLLEDIHSRITAYGRLRSSQPVVLNSEVTGRLERGDVAFRPGQSFRRGDLLVKVDDRQVRLDINREKSRLLNALASVLPEIRVDFPDDYAVWQEYFNDCSFDRTLRDLPPAANQKIKLYLSRFSVYQIYFSIRDLEVLHEKHFFYAPFDGSITDAALRIGSNVRPGSRIGEIINLESLEAEMPVPAEDVQWVTCGSPVTITSEEIQGTWTGTVRRIGKKIDTRTQTVQIYVVLDAQQDERLYDGVFITASLQGRLIPESAVVPRRALYENRYVYVVENGMLGVRQVTIERSEHDYVIVSKGLENGDRLVTEMLQGVASGMPARPRADNQEGSAP